MEIKTNELVELLKREIENYERDIDMGEVGVVVEVGDGIARIFGLDNVMANEMIEFPNGAIGLALNLAEDAVGAIILGDEEGIAEGDSVKRLKRVLEVPVGKELVGRVVNPLGEPLDGKGAIAATHTRPVEYKAPGIASRTPVTEPLQTGIKAIDAMTPIGRGQRELIIGDRGTGKTALAIDTILNQKGRGVYCVYVAIGQKGSTVAHIARTLEREGAMDYTTVVSATASDSAPLLYIAPYAGTAMAEYFMYSERAATLCVYDDLTKQADAYRQISLLLRRPPGREAYPGDVFYLHSRLLERAAKLCDELGGGSLTALPIVETQEGEMAAYIPTNVISITDGQIYLQSDIFNAGTRPAINPGISVSRVGGNAQIPAMKEVAGTLRLDLANYRNLEAFLQIGADVGKETQQQLDRGRRMIEILKQPQYAPLSEEEEVVILYAASKGYLDDVLVARAGEFESRLLAHMRQMYQPLLDDIKQTGKITDKAALDRAIISFKVMF